jgi:nucleoside-diphosphate-sugar epimerase
MAKILITGAGGLIGRQVPAFLSPHEVHALSTQPPPADGTLTWHQGNLHDPEQTRKLLATVRPSHLLHLAWDTTHGQFWQSPSNFQWVQSSLELLRQFQAQGGERVVYVGTGAEYDGDAELCQETTPLRPESPYAVCKASLSQLFESFCTLHTLSGAWARIFLLFGPHEPPQRLVPSIIRALQADTPARCGSGTQIRDFLYVKDVASALATTLLSPVTGAINIGSGQPRSIAQVATRTAELLGRPELLQLGALPPRPGDPPCQLADTRRLRDEVGWQPHYSLDQGLTETIKWWASPPRQRSRTCIP